MEIINTILGIIGLGVILHFYAILIAWGVAKG